MIIPKDKRTLELIGINNDRRTQVLMAVSSSVVRYGAPVGINEISEELQNILGYKMVNPLIYRYLKSLEEDNLIIKTRSRPARYWIDLESIILAVQILYDRKLKELKSRAEEIKDLRSKISRMDISKITDKFVSKRALKLAMKRPTLVMGVEKILNLISKEVYGQVKKGDVVRVCADWLVLSTVMELQQHKIVEEILKRGAEVRVLSSIKWSTDKRLEKIRKKNYQRLKEKYKVDYRYLPKQLHSYQFVSRNRESCVIIFSNRPYSAVWFPQGQKDPIVNDAIQVFDEDWKTSIDMLMV